MPGVDGNHGLTPCDACGGPAPESFPLFVCGGGDPGMGCGASFDVCQACLKPQPRERANRKADLFARNHACKHKPAELLAELSDDPEITCIACSEPGCEMSIRLWAKYPGSTVWVGLHRDCLPRR